MKTTPKAPQPPTQFKEEEVANPKLVKPSFNDINVDSAGNQKRLTPNSGLTKLGALFSILGGGVQGMSDALAGGAMDAHNGPDRPSAFGLGVRGAQEMPLIRAARQREIEEHQLKEQNMAAQTANLQGETQLHKAQIPYFLQRGQAYNALAQKRGNLSTQEQLDLATQDALDNGRDPNIDPNVLQLRQALKAENDAKAKGGAGGANAEPKNYEQMVLAAQQEEDPNGPYHKAVAQIEQTEKKRFQASQPRPSFTEEAFNEAHAADPTLTRADFLANKTKKQPTATFKDTAAVDAYSDKWYQNQRRQVELDKYRAWEMAGKPEGDDAVNNPGLQAKYAAIDDQYNKDANAFENRKKGYYAGVAQGRPVSVDENGDVMENGSQPQSAQPTKKSPVPALNTGKKSRPPLSSFDHSTGK